MTVILPLILNHWTRLTWTEPYMLPQVFSLLKYQMVFQNLPLYYFSECKLSSYKPWILLVFRGDQSVISLYMYQVRHYPYQNTFSFILTLSPSIMVVTVCRGSSTFRCPSLQWSNKISYIFQEAYIIIVMALQLLIMPG